MWTNYSYKIFNGLILLGFDLVSFAYSGKHVNIKAKQNIMIPHESMTKKYNEKY